MTLENTLVVLGVAVLLLVVLAARIGERTGSLVRDLCDVARAQAFDTRRLSDLEAAYCGHVHNHGIPQGDRSGGYTSGPLPSPDPGKSVPYTALTVSLSRSWGSEEPVSTTSPVAWGEPPS